MNRIILTKTIVLTEFVFHLKNISAVCTDDTHKNGRLFRGGVAYIYIDLIRQEMSCPFMSFRMEMNFEYPDDSRLYFVELSMLF